MNQEILKTETFLFKDVKLKFYNRNGDEVNFNDVETVYNFEAIVEGINRLAIRTIKFPTFSYSKSEIATIDIEYVENFEELYKDDDFIMGRVNLKGEKVNND